MTNTVCACDMRWNASETLSIFGTIVLIIISKCFGLDYVWTLQHRMIQSQNCDGRRTLSKPNMQLDSFSIWYNESDHFEQTMPYASNSCEYIEELEMENPKQWLIFQIKWNCWTNVELVCSLYCCSSNISNCSWSIFSICFFVHFPST